MSVQRRTPFPRVRMKENIIFCVLPQILVCRTIETLRRLHYSKSINSYALKSCTAQCSRNWHTNVSSLTGFYIRLTKKKKCKHQRNRIIIDPNFVPCHIIWLKQKIAISWDEIEPRYLMMIYCSKSWGQKWVDMSSRMRLWEEKIRARNKYRSEWKGGETNEKARKKNEKQKIRETRESGARRKFIARIFLLRDFYVRAMYTGHLHIHIHT